MFKHLPQGQTSQKVQGLSDLKVEVKCDQLQNKDIKSHVFDDNYSRLHGINQSGIPYYSVGVKSEVSAIAH